jgi:AcrR family transcriptional regulator
MIVSEKAIINKSLFLKDPQSTKLGERIIDSSIKIIDKIGFDNFNFKKLAIDINSTEASIYRYFENKHKLLLYLVSWYWSWVNSKLEQELINEKDSKRKLEIIINIICLSSFDDPETEMIDEEALTRIVITESSKAFSSKQVEDNYDEGLFEAYKSVCNIIINTIKEANPKYKNPKALSTSLIRLVHGQIFMVDHLPYFTDINVTKDDFSSLENL